MSVLRNSTSITPQTPAALLSQNLVPYGPPTYQNPAYQNPAYQYGGNTTLTPIKVKKNKMMLPLMIVGGVLLLIILITFLSLALPRFKSWLMRGKTPGSGG